MFLSALIFQSVFVTSHEIYDYLYEAQHLRTIWGFLILMSLFARKHRREAKWSVSFCGEQMTDTDWVMRMLSTSDAKRLCVSEQAFSTHNR